jgi:hypothetical protein
LRVRYSRKRVLNVFTAWHHFSTESIKRNNTVKYFLEDSNERKLKKFFENWQSYVAVRRNTNAKLTQMTVRNQSKTLLESFAVWVGHYNWKLQKQKIKVYATEVGYRTVKKHAWSAWVQQFEVRKLQKQDEVFAGKYHQSTMLARHYHNWKANYQWRIIEQQVRYQA